GGDDGYHVVLGDGCVEPAGVPDVVVVAVHVDELVQIAGLGDELALEARVAGHQTVEQLTHGRPLGGDRRGPADVRAQDGGQADFDRHHGGPPPSSLQNARDRVSF